MYDRLKRELSYVQGLLEGINTHQNTPESKVLQRLVDVMDELIDAVQQLDGRQVELEEYVEAIDEDLNEVELLTYEDDEDDFIEEEPYEEDYDEDDIEDDQLHITCPECGEDVYVDLEDLEDSEVELLCPECHTVLILEDATDVEPQNSGVNEAETI